MVSLEQVKLLESKVSKTIEYVKKVTEENSHLKTKLDSYQNRIEELEVLIRRFKEDQSKIEDGILAALDRLNQFEDALETKLSADSSELMPDKNLPKDNPVPPNAPENAFSEEMISEPAHGELDIF